MPDVVKVALVRHGHTALSYDDYFCGASDPPLSPEGREMAEAVGERCAAEPWAALYASPLARARETAEAIGRRVGLPVLPEPAFREMDFGEWDGRRASEIERAVPGLYSAWVEHPAAVAPPGGETAADVARRALPALDAIVGRHPGGSALVVSHKGTIRIILCALLGVDLDLYRARIGSPVAGLSIVEFRPTGPLVTLLGDTSHLPPHLRRTAGV
jgi:probable phosphoglycerate mutase